jgi:uncharacterized protein
MTNERLVFDTNVLISAMLWPSSVPGRVLDHAVTHCQLLGSVELLEELVSTFLSGRFDPYVPRAEREMLLERLIPLMELVEPVQVVRACRDPRDDKVLETAVNGRADAVITGDKDLLVLHPFLDINVLTPAAYLEDVQDHG